MTSLRECIRRLAGAPPPTTFTFEEATQLRKSWMHVRQPKRDFKNISETKVRRASRLNSQENQVPRPELPYKNVGSRAKESDQGVRALPVFLHLKDCADHSLALLSYSFEGTLTKYSFKSTTLGGLSANFNVYLPPSVSSSSSSASPVPILFYLSGLTCTEDNATQKAPTFLEAAAKEGIAIVFPDTSPRGANIEGEDESYDFGSGAGFYVNATKEPWSKHYKMYDHVVKELPEMLKKSGLPLVRDLLFGWQAQADHLQPFLDRTLRACP